MRVHPKYPNIFATGGDERQLCVWDISKPQTTAPNSDENQLKIITPIWQAKNVPNDYLDMRVPIWITDIQWLSVESYSQLATSTAYHSIRAYDLKQRKPILNHESCGDHPIRSLCVKGTNLE